MLAVAESPDPDLIGTIIDGRFQVEAHLSEGGMGTVFRGRHVLLGKPLAIKVLRGCREERARRRFLQEARAGSSLHHENIVDISDFGLLADGRPYLIMELLVGETLGRAMKAGPLTPVRACRIAAQMAHGLQAVHERGIVHRDLKPENVFLFRSQPEALDAEERVKILDFGVAKMLDGPRMTQLGMGPVGSGETMENHLTRSGCVVGTPEYIAPEQALNLEIDHRADQYALGCILYEMITGSLPFQDIDAESLLLRHVKEPPIPPRRRRPDLTIPIALEAIVLRMLDKNRDRRFESMRKLQRALAAEAMRLGRARTRPGGARWRTPASFLLGIGIAAMGMFELSRSARRAPKQVAPVAQAPEPRQVAPAAMRQPLSAAVVQEPARPAPGAGVAKKTSLKRRLIIQPEFPDGALVSCPPRVHLSCRGRCVVDLGVRNEDTRCVVSHPGYQKHHLIIAPGLSEPDGISTPGPTQRITLQACTMDPKEECEPALALAP